MKARLTQRERTQRAFRVYLDLIDTAEWLKTELRGQMESFGLTFSGLRVLAMLYREGRMALADAARERRCNRQNMDVIVARLERRGWVRQGLLRRRAVKIKKSRLPKVQRGKQRLGREVAVMSLTPEGERFVGTVLPKHAKMVKSLMRALDAREQDSLGQLCAKLREGDVVKFISEITHLDAEVVNQARELMGH